MSGVGDLTERLVALLGDLSVDEIGVAITRRIEPDDTISTDPAEFELPVLDPDNRLVLGEALGQGGAGIVYSAVQQSLDRRVAVKRLRPDRALPANELGLWREAWIGGLLTHPNIVAIYDLDTDDSGRPAMVCQHVDGEPWSRSLSADFDAGRMLQRPTLERHLRILLEVCDAVAFAHSRGFLHRDIKPDNVMVGKFGEVYLIDWGIAVALDDRYGNRFPMTDDVQSISGTPCYMAPELIRDRDDQALYVGVPTDVYLLGGTLFQILCGRPPHAVGQLDEILESIQVSEFEFPAEVPKEIAAICSKALAREPGARYQTASELGAAVSEFLAKQQAREILAHARDKLSELERMSREGATAESPVEGPDRLELYRRFSECKFGFGSIAEVLGEQARRGIRAAAETMVAYELGRDDPDAAEAVLAEVGESEVGEEVVAEIAAARGRKDAELETLKNYAAVGRSHDARRGVRARFLLACLGVSLVIAGPVIRLMGHGLDVALSSAQQIVTAALGVLGFGAVAWFFRRYLRNHAVTRAATMIFLSIGLIHTLLGVSAYLGDIGPWFLRIINGYVIGMGCLVFGLLFERAILWSALIFLSGGLAISTVAGGVVERNLVILGCAVFFALNALVVWNPRSRRDKHRA